MSAKADGDVGITLDVMEYAAKVDKVILLSGDGDFDLLLLKISTEIRHEVYGVETLTAPALIRAADQFVPISGSLLM